MKNKITGAAKAVPVFVLNPLKADDVFIMAQMIGKIGVGRFFSSLDKDTLEKIMALKDDPEMLRDINVSAASLKLMNIVLVNIEAVKQELYDLLARASGKTSREIGELEAGEFVALLHAFIAREETWDFFTEVSRLISTAL